MDDITLLQEYAQSSSESAFAALVERHVGLVYSAALRQVRDSQYAEDVTQAVFVVLARKAGQVARHPGLSGWLLQTTRYAANSHIRTAVRRTKREQEAAMQNELNDSFPDIWPQLKPHLDEAMASLCANDRAVLALRYFENKTAAEIGKTLKLSEEAAKKRVHRALEKLQKVFVKRGIHSTTAILAGTISTNAIQIAPLGLAKTISAVAVAKGATASASTLTLIKGALKIMAWSKAKTAAAVGVAAIIAMSTTTVVVKETFFPTIKDTYFQPNYRYFQNLPRGLFTLRPTHFTSPVEGVDYSGETSSPSGEHVTLFMGRNRSFEQLVATAYGGYLPYTVFPANTPKDRFDYLCTVLDGQAYTRLQTTIRKKLGYTATWQERDTEVLLLKSRFQSSALKPAHGMNGSQTWRDSESRLEFRNRFLWQFINELERTINMPVLDQTGRTNAFDFDLNCSRMDLVNRNWDEINRALNGLGLELVFTNLPTKLLVVEKVK